MKTYKITYRFDNPCGLSGSIFDKGLSYDKAIYILRAHNDLFGSFYIMSEE